MGSVKRWGKRGMRVLRLRIFDAPLRTTEVESAFVFYLLF